MSIKRLNRANFLIQIIGAPSSGKTTLAKKLEEFMVKELKMEVHNCDLVGDLDDFRDLSEKTAIITTFRDQNDPVIEPKGEKS